MKILVIGGKGTVGSHVVREPNGPEVLSGAKIASIWSDLLGKPVAYPGEDLDGFEAQMRQRAPAWSAFDLRMMFRG